MKLKGINVCVILLTVMNHSQSASVRGTGDDDILVDIKGKLEEICLSLSRLLNLVNSLTTSPAPLSSTILSTELPHASSTPLPPETSGDSSTESTTDFKTDTATYSSVIYSTDFPTKISTYLTTFEESTQLSSESSTFPPAESSTFPTVESSTFPTVESSTFPPAESSTFPTVESSTFPPAESSTFPTVESSTFPPAESSTFPPAESSTFPTVESSTFPPAESSTFTSVESSTFFPAESSTFPAESSTSTELSPLPSAELSISVELSSLPPKPLTQLSTKPSNLHSESIFQLSTKTTGFLTDKSPAPVLTQLSTNQLIEHSTYPSTQSTARSSTGKSSAESTHLATEKQRTESSTDLFIDSTKTLVGFAFIQLATDWSIPTQNEANENIVEKSTELSSGAQAVILTGPFSQQSGESSTHILTKSTAELSTKLQDTRDKNELANAQFCTSRYQAQNSNYVTGIKTSGRDLCKRLSSALDNILKVTRKMKIDIIKEEQRKELQEYSDDLEESVIGVEQDPLFIYAINVEVFTAYLKDVDKSVDEAKTAVEEKMSTFPTLIVVVSSIGACFASAVLVFGGVLVYRNKNCLMCRSQ
ncbi:mucin-3A-like [Penaeus chinensis]|uniref:mucin-3A-like n=1 Tax=Penaeus chinensis TaxID=139456 RepID=UPI001FB61940|nr:mucin-3A-like [Penaeus chinensis]